MAGGGTWLQWATAPAPLAGKSPRRGGQALPGLPLPGCESWLDHLFYQVRLYFMDDTAQDPGIPVYLAGGH